MSNTKPVCGLEFCILRIVYYLLFEICSLTSPTKKCRDYEKKP